MAVHLLRRIVGVVITIQKLGEAKHAGAPFCCCGGLRHRGVGGLVNTGGKADGCRVGVLGNARCGR